MGAMPGISMTPGGGPVLSLGEADGGGPGGGPDGGGEVPVVVGVVVGAEGVVVATSRVGGAWVVTTGAGGGASTVAVSSTAVSSTAVGSSDGVAGGGGSGRSAGDCVLTLPVSGAQPSSRRLPRPHDTCRLPAAQLAGDTVS
jgi:hypothetical protein